MDSSPPFAALISTPSPDGTLLATVTAAPSPTSTTSTRRTITVRSLASLAIVAQWKDLPRVGLQPGRRPASLRWAHPLLRNQKSETATLTNTAGTRVATSLMLSTHNFHRRLLYADDRGVIVLDVLNPEWRAVFGNGSGSMGKIVFADFATSSSGQVIGPPLMGNGGIVCGMEVLVFFEFGSQVVVFFVDGLMVGKSVVIRDPKQIQPPGLGLSFRERKRLDGSQTKGDNLKPSTDRVMAVLSRPGAHDILTLHSGLGRNGYGVIATTILPTVDAQGLKWSPCGNWMAIWENESLGCVVHVYTATGGLYRTYDMSTDGVTIDREGEEMELPKLGVRILEWSPNSEYLAIGTFDRKVVLLSAKTFSPTVFLDHTPTVEIDPYPVWMEQSSCPGTYSEGHQPVTVPVASGSITGPDGLPKSGITQLTFSADGGLLATVSEAHPNTIWIWDIRQMIARTVIVQRGAIKLVRWHPRIEGALLICCAPVGAKDESVVYLWEAGWLDQDDHNEDGDNGENNKGKEGEDGKREENGEDKKAVEAEMAEEIPTDSPPVLVPISREFCLSSARTGKGDATGTGNGMQRLDVQWLNTELGRQACILLATCPLGSEISHSMTLSAYLAGTTAAATTMTTTTVPSKAVIQSTSSSAAPSSSFSITGKTMAVWPGGRDRIFRLDHDEKMLYGKIGAETGEREATRDGDDRKVRREGVDQAEGGHGDGGKEGWSTDVDDSVFDILTQRMDAVSMAGSGDGEGMEEEQEEGQEEGQEDGMRDVDDSGEQGDSTEYEYDDEIDGEVEDEGGAAYDPLDQTSTMAAGDPFFPHDSVEHVSTDEDDNDDDGRAEENYTSDYHRTGSATVTATSTWDSWPSGVTHTPNGTTSNANNINIVGNGPTIRAIGSSIEDDGQNPFAKLEIRAAPPPAMTATLATGSRERRPGRGLDVGTGPARGVGTGTGTGIRPTTRHTGTTATRRPSAMTVRPTAARTTSATSAISGTTTASGRTSGSGSGSTASAVLGSAGRRTAPQPTTGNAIPSGASKRTTSAVDRFNARIRAIDSNPSLNPNGGGMGTARSGSRSGSGSGNGGNDRADSGARAAWR